MKREKSCGAVVYRYDNNHLSILLLRHCNGCHWSFPKGHMEAGESERQTALREILEETGLHVSLKAGFRYAVEYSPKPGVRKQVIYFLGQADHSPLVRQVEEIGEIRWAPIEEAIQAVTFKNDRFLIEKAKQYLQPPEKVH